MEARSTWCIALVLLVGAVPSCARRNDGAGASPSTDAGLSASATPSVASSHPAEDDANAAHVTDAPPPVVDARTVTSSCRLVYGPAEQPFRGPAAIVEDPATLLLVTNEHGKAHIFPVAVEPPPAVGAPPPPPPRPSSFVTAQSNPCEVAGLLAYCPDSDGTVYRTNMGTNDTKAVAKGRPGTRIAAASLDEYRSVVATLDTRRTSEGEVLQAFVTLDDRLAERLSEQRLSEEGAGATAVRMVPRGHGAVAVYLDARTAMVPVHARTLRMQNDKLSLGRDAVVFIGGPPERGIDVTLAATDDRLHAIVPLAQNARDFGMVVIGVGDPPKEDAPSVWSLYPNGLDPALIGATTNDTLRTWVSRVRPADASAHSPRVLELGRIDDAGAFTSMGILADANRVTHIAMAVDGFRAVWILYGDASHTWLERRICP